MDKSANVMSVPATTQPRGGVLPPGTVATRLGIARLSAGTGQNPAGEVFPQDAAADWIFVGTIDGGAEVTTTAGTFREGKADVLVVPPHWKFQERSVGNSAWHWIYVRLKLARQSRLTPLLDTLRKPALIRPGAAAFQSLCEIADVLHRRPWGADMETVGQLLIFLTAVQRTLAGWNARAAPPFVERACALMRERFVLGVSIAELARHCAMSESSFAHRFKLATGMSPIEWFRRERLRLARQLLLAGQSVKEAAAATGFADPFHFSRTFRNSEGLPPARFQQVARVGRTSQV